MPFELPNASRNGIPEICELRKEAFKGVVLDERFPRIEVLMQFAIAGLKYDYQHDCL